MRGIRCRYLFLFFGFFLFSDQLVYAHQLFSGDWKMHEQLLLALIKVVDVKVGTKGPGLPRGTLALFVLFVFHRRLSDSAPGWAWWFRRRVRPRKCLKTCGGHIPAS